MERKIGDTFEFEGKKLQVKESASNGCDGCFFYMKCSSITMGLSGECEVDARDDGKDVIFVEVQEQPQQAEQPQETKEGRERRIGEVFEYKGKKLKVVDGENECDKCYFYNNIYCTRIDRIAGACLMSRRIDNKSVKFVEVTEEHETQQAEQPQEQAEQPRLNLCEILKHCPKGEMFWSPLLGDVKLYGTDQETEKVVVTAVGNVNWSINADGTIPIESFTSPEIMLYPSREQRDWTKVKYEPKKEKFDPKTLKSFDRVITRNEYDEWTCALFSHIGNKPNTRFIYVTCESVYEYCIPYNDETKHLVGTKDEAPEYYRYWED